MALTLETGPNEVRIFGYNPGELALPPERSAASELLSDYAVIREPDAKVPNLISGESTLAKPDERPSFR